jgi:hypothetical protein
VITDVGALIGQPADLEKGIHNHYLGTWVRNGPLGELPSVGFFWTAFGRLTDGEEVADQRKIKGGANMALVVCDQVSPGLRDSERSVAIKDVHGRRQHLRVPFDFLTNKEGKFYITVGVVHVDPKTRAVLVELPHEADSGANRLWVWPQDLLEPLEAVT